MKFPIVKVEWVDSSIHGGWNSLEDYQTRQPAPAMSVGYLISKSKGRLVIVQTLGDNSVCDSISIPRGCVVNIETLGHQTFPLVRREV